MVQWGIAALPAETATWDDQPIPDDPVLVSNAAWTVSFATAGPDTRTTQARGVCAAAAEFGWGVNANDNMSSMD